MAAGGLIMAAAAAARKQAIRSVDAAWSPYAKAHGMNHRAGRPDDEGAGDPRVDGTVDGISVAFQLATMGGDWGVTAIAVPPTPLRLKLEITREGVFDKVAKVFGAKDLVLGDAAFDKAYMVGTTDESARELLSENTRKEMISLGVSTLAYDDGSVEGHKAKLMLSIDHLVIDDREIDRLLRLLVALAKVAP